MALAVKGKSPAIIGLDIGSNFIKFCVGRVRSGQVELLAVGVAPTPAHAVVENEIVDPAALGQALRVILQEAGIKEKNVVSSVAGQSSLVVRIIEVPRMTKKELQETMKWEVERHVPFAAEQTVMDYQPLVPIEQVPEGGNMEVLLAVAQESLVMAHLGALKEAKLSPKAIDIEPLATARGLLALTDGEIPASCVAVVDFGANTTDINIYKDGRIAFTRTIQIAGNNLTKAIAETLLKSPEESEHLKIEYGRAPAVETDTGPDLDEAGLAEMEGFDFGDDEDGIVLGGTFGAGAEADADTGADTAVPDEGEPTVDVAGAGFGADAFAVPEGGEASTEEAAAADAEAPAEDASSAPMFDVAAAPAGASPFDSGPSDTAPGDAAVDIFGTDLPADPFAPAADSGTDPGASTTQLPGAAAAEPMSDDEYLRTQIADAVTPVLEELVTELHRSLEFYRNRANGLGAEQLILCGGSAKLPGLADYLAAPANLDLPVVLANPLAHLARAESIDAAYVEDVSPVCQVAVGLMLREMLQDTPGDAPAPAPVALPDAAPGAGEEAAASAEPALDGGAAAAEVAPIPATEPTATRPDSIPGLNWGALFFGWWWGIFNKVWIAFIPLFPLYLLFKGNDLAWNGPREWESEEQFRAVQGKWAKWGVGLLLAGLVLVVVLVILSVLGLVSPFNAGVQEMSLPGGSGVIDLGGAGLEGPGLEGFGLEGPGITLPSEGAVPGGQ